MGMLQSKMHIWEENSGNFMVFDEEGEMDTESLEMYENYKFDILSGNYEDFEEKYDADIKTIEGKYKEKSQSYSYLDRLHEAVKAENMTVGETKRFLEEAMQGAEAQEYNATTGVLKSLEKYIAQRGENAIVDEQWFVKQQKLLEESGNKYNAQYRVLTGELYEENPLWKYFDADDETIKALKRQEFAKTGEGFADPFEGGEDAGGEGGDLGGGEDEGTEGEGTEGEGTEGEDITEDEVDDSEGIDMSSVLKTVGVATAVGTGLAYKDKVAQVGKTMYNSTKRAAKWIKSSVKISGAQIDEFLNSKQVKNTLNNLESLENKLKSLEDKKGSKEYKDTLKRMKKLKGSRTAFWAKKWGVSEKDVGKLWDSKSKWNIFQVKNTLMNKLPKAAGEFFTKPSGTAGRIGLGYGQFRTGKAVADAVGLDLGEGFLAETGEAAAGGAAAHQAIKQTTKRLLPKIGRMIVSDKGKKFLIKKLGKQAVAKIGTSIVAGGGVASLVTGLIGLGLTAKDIYKAVQNYKEEE